MQPLSAYVHIPFCISPCLYCACNKIITHKLDRIDSYVQRVIKEIELRASYFSRARPIDQMHFGGGTPSYLPIKSLMAIVESLSSHFRVVAEWRTGFLDRSRSAWSGFRETGRDDAGRFQSHQLRRAGF